MSKAEVNKKVKVHYKGTFTDGTVFDSSEGKQPLEFVLGSGQVIPGFDKGIEGMTVNETKTINIPSTDAYGEHRPELIQELPKKDIPADINYEAGMQLMSKTQNGQDIPITVAEVKDESIVIDANHPLAGKDLVFEVTLVDVA